MRKYDFGDSLRHYYHLAVAIEQEVHVHVKGTYEEALVRKALILRFSRLVLHYEGEWIPWGGGKMPVPEEVEVDVKFKGQDSRYGCIPSGWGWDVHSDKSCCITHYRLHVKEVAKPPLVSEYKPPEVIEPKVTDVPAGLLADTTMGTVLEGDVSDWSKCMIEKVMNEHTPSQGWRGTTDTATVPAVSLSGDFKIEINLEDCVDNSTEKSKLRTQTKTTEVNNMTTITRTMMTVTLIDNDAGIDVSDSLVFTTQVNVENGDTQTEIQELIYKNEKLTDAIEKHNKLRKETVNLELLERTGREVMLREVKLKDLTWGIK